MCGGISGNDFIRNFLVSLIVGEFLKSVCWQLVTVTVTYSGDVIFCVILYLWLRQQLIRDAYA